MPTPDTGVEACPGQRGTSGAGDTLWAASCLAMSVSQSVWGVGGRMLVLNGSLKTAADTQMAAMCPWPLVTVRTDTLSASVTPPA